MGSCKGVRCSEQGGKGSCLGLEARSLCCCVTLGKFLHLSVLVSLDDHNFYPRGLLEGINKP